MTLNWDQLGKEPPKVWKDMSQVKGLTDVTSVSASQGSIGIETDAAVKKDGTLWIWGALQVGIELVIGDPSIGIQWNHISSESKKRQRCRFSFFFDPYTYGGYSYKNGKELTGK